MENIFLQFFGHQILQYNVAVQSCLYLLSYGDWMISHMSHNLLICIEDKIAFCPQQRSKGDPGRTAGLQTPLRTAVH